MSATQVHKRTSSKAGSRLTPRTSRPHVIVNMAMTADGKIATANRAVSSFGSPHDHNHLLELRATADAVLCGANTAGGENITLGPGPSHFRRQRLKRGLAEYNLRVIASGSGNLDPQSFVFEHRFSPIIVLTTKRASPAKLKRLREVANEVMSFGNKELDLKAALKWLHKQWKVNRLICEGGGALNDAMFRARLVDELHLTLCPLIFGGQQAPTIVEGSGFQRLAHATQLQLRSRRLVGREMFLIYDVLCDVSAPSRVSIQRAISQSRSANRLK